MYRVVHEFIDLQDEDFLYNVGDVYPRKGSEPTEERIAELSGDKNKIGEVLIEKVKKKTAPKKPKEVKE